MEPEPFTVRLPVVVRFPAVTILLVFASALLAILLTVFAKAYAALLTPETESKKGTTFIPATVIELTTVTLLEKVALLLKRAVLKSALLETLTWPPITKLFAMYMPVFGARALIVPYTLACPFATKLNVVLER